MGSDNAELTAAKVQLVVGKINEQLDARDKRIAELEREARALRDRVFEVEGTLERVERERDEARQERDQHLERIQFFQEQAKDAWRERDEAREKTGRYQDKLLRILERLCPRYLDTNGEDEADRAIRVIDAVLRERDEARENSQQNSQRIVELRDRINQLKARCREEADVLESLEYKCMGCREDVEEVIKRLRKAGGE